MKLKRESNGQKRATSKGESKRVQMDASKRAFSSAQGKNFSAEKLAEIPSPRAFVKKALVLALFCVINMA
jgi:hypothetical protein